MTKEEHAGGVNSVSHAIRLVELLSTANAPMNVSQIAKALALPRATVYRLLKTLGDHHWISAEKTTYRISYRLLGFLSQSGGLLALSNRVKPALHELVQQTGETAHFAVLDGDCVSYVEKVDSPHPIRMFSHVGWRGPLHATGAGKALLAWSPEETATRLVEKPLERHTPHTITERDVLLAEIAAIRKRGYASDNEELIEGLTCVAIPLILDGVLLGVFSVSGPSSRMNACADIAKTMREIVLDGKGYDSPEICP